MRHGVEPLGERRRRVIDPLVIDKAVDRYRKGKRTLEAAAELYGVALDDAHDAGADAIAAGRVAQAMARTLPRPARPAGRTDLHDLQVGWCATQAASFQDYMRRTKDPTFTTSGEWPHRRCPAPDATVPLAADSRLHDESCCEVGAGAARRRAADRGGPPFVVRVAEACYLPKPL